MAIDWRANLPLSNIRSGADPEAPCEGTQRGEVEIERVTRQLPQGPGAPPFCIRSGRITRQGDAEVKAFLESRPRLPGG